MREDRCSSVHPTPGFPCLSVSPWCVFGTHGFIFPSEHANARECVCSWLRSAHSRVAAEMVRLLFEKRVKHQMTWLELLLD